MRGYFNIRRILKLSVFGICFFACGFSYNYYLPKLEIWLLEKVKKQSQENLPVKISPQQLSVQLFPLGIVLRNVEIKPKKALLASMAPTEITEVGAHLNLFSLIRGQIRLSRVYLKGADFNIFIDTKIFEGQKNQKPTEFDFDTIFRLPIDQIDLQDVVLQGKLLPNNIVFRSEAINLVVENRYRSLLIELDIPKIMLKPSGPTRPINVQMQARGLIESKEAQISAFKIKADESYLVASGRVNGNFSKIEIENSAFKSRGHFVLKDLAYWLETIPQIKKSPRLDGVIDVDLSAESQFQKKVSNLSIEVNGSDLIFDKFNVGNLHATGLGNLEAFKFSTIQLKNSAGEAELKDSTVSRLPFWNIKTTVLAKQIEIGKLLSNLGVHAPVHLLVNGQANCQGEWNNNPELKCQPQIKASQLKVSSDGKSKAVIVEAENFTGDGQVTINKKEVTYSANGKLGAKTVGKSNGVINYDTGFKINFESESVSMSDIKNLANLKLEGSAKIKGTTSGTAHWGTVTMKVNGTDIWLDDYPLGQITTDATYKAGQLVFANAQGQLGISRYTGTVTVDLLNDRIAIDGQIPFAELKDIFGAFQRKTTQEFYMNGTGTGTLKAFGPFDFRKMSYTLKSSFFRGAIYNENFDRMIFNVSATDGFVKSDSIQLIKANGQVDMSGTINPEGMMDAKVVGKKLRLEQSENMLNFGFDLQGQADFDLFIKGQLPRPKIELNTKLSKMVLAERPVDDSQLELKFFPNHIEGKGKLLGSMIDANFNFPLEPNLPFALKLKTQRWDFTSLFSVLSKSARQLDFETLATMDVDLQANTGGFWNSSGEVKISEFSIRKGTSQMRSEKPMRLDFNSGQISSRDFEISSGDSFLRLEAKKLSKENLAASLNGKMDLSLLGLLTPFISDLRGNLSLSMDLKGTVEAPNMSGSAYIDKGYVKLRDFPHPFASLRADILFNQRQILLNALRADFASGKVAGEGRVEFLGHENNPISIKGNFNDVSLNFPEGFLSKGSGQVNMKGSQFPYLLEIQYDITGGEIISEFASSGSTGPVKASTYLPKFIINDSFQPLTYSVDVSLKNPVTINNSLLQSQVSGHVKASGTPDRLLLTGTMTPLPGGKALFKDVPFDINTGYVEFQNSPPENPKIYLTATTTVKETVSTDETHQQENQYDVSLLVQGRGQNPQITLTSQPPLSQKELVSLLALGLTPEAFDQSRKGNTEASTSTALGAAILQKPVSKKLKDTLGVDVKLSSSQATQENASTPKVTFSKQWTPKFGASASGTIQSNPTSDVKVEYKFNRSTSVIGSWEGKEQGSNLEKSKDTSKSIFGLDLEYKVQFK